MRRTFVPSAVTPPSANRKACTASTTVRHSVAVAGPTSTAARAAPRRWPEVPAPTGKFTICAAKTKTATSPASGAVRSSSSWRAARTRAAPTTPAATTPVATDVGASRKPSGTCMEVLRWGAGLVANESQQPVQPMRSAGAGSTPGHRCRARVSPLPRRRSSRRRRAPSAARRGARGPRRGCCSRGAPSAAR